LELKLLNVVILAEDYARLRDWWIDALELDLLKEWTENYHYAELAKDGRYVVGIGSAAEMGVEPAENKKSFAVPQLKVGDVAVVLDRVKEKGGKAVFGPSFDEAEKFWYGAFEDIEGNSVWVVAFGPEHSAPGIEA